MNQSWLWVVAVAAIVLGAMGITKAIHHPVKPAPPPDSRVVMPNKVPQVPAAKPEIGPPAKPIAKPPLPKPRPKTAPKRPVCSDADWFDRKC